VLFLLIRVISVPFTCIHKYTGNFTPGLDFVNPSEAN
jgi:hypothetical protein